MLIDWFTVIAQVINFLILVWLLKRFLYTPILNAIQQRKQKIKGQLEEADAKLAEAREEKEAFRRKNEAFEQKRSSLLNEANEEAGALRQKLLENARKEAGNLRSQLEASIKEEKEHLNREIVERTQHEVLAIARRVLSDLADVKLEEHIVQQFLQQLENADRRSMKTFFEKPSQEVIVRSTFELSEAQRQKIREAIQLIVAGKELRFETSPQTISGIELTTGDYKMAWSIGDYLDALEKKIDELLSQEASSTIKPAPHESTSR